MKIALHDSEYSNNLILEYRENRDARDYPRTSEWVEVDFPMLPRADVVKAKVATIDLKMEEARAAYQVLMNSLEDEKAKLLAITHDA